MSDCNGTMKHIKVLDILNCKYCEAYIRGDWSKLNKKEVKDE
jgi:hypothetical protein